MRQHIAWLVVVTFAVLGADARAHCGKCGIGEKEHEHAHAEIGAAAPGFTLTSAEGEKVSLSDFKGKVVVLEWTNHKCPYVKAHVGKKQSMQKTLKRFEKKGVVWLAIDSSYSCEEESDDIKTFAAKNGVSYPVLLDAAGEVGRVYGAKSTPHMFVIDKKGLLIYSGAIDDDPTLKKLEPRNYVEEAIEASLNGSTVPVSTTKPYGCSVKYAP